MTNPYYQEDYLPVAFSDNHRETSDSSPIVVSVRIERGARARFLIKLSLKPDLLPPDAASNRVFFRQKMKASTWANCMEEMCRLASEPGNSLLRIQIKIPSTIYGIEHQWYSMIRYMLFCWHQQNSPALVFSVQPDLLTLFVVSETSSYLATNNLQQHKLINRMVALRLEHWLARPGYLAGDTGSPRTGIGSYAQYHNSVARAIYDTMQDRQVETIQELIDYVATHYGLLTRFKWALHTYTDLRFKYKALPWLYLHQIAGLSTSTIRLWLDFNRQLKHHPIGERVAQKIIR